MTSAGIDTVTMKSTATADGCTCPELTGYTTSDSLAATDSSGNVLTATDSQNGVAVSFTSAGGTTCSKRFSVKALAGSGDTGTGTGTGTDAGTGAAPTGDDTGGKSNKWLIPAIAGGAAVAVIVIAGVAGFVYKRRKRSREARITPTPQASPTHLSYPPPPMYEGSPSRDMPAAHTIDMPEAYPQSAKHGGNWVMSSVNDVHGPQYRGC